IEEHVDVSAEEAALTKPEDAARFVERSGADYPAVAIGTTHGPYNGKGRPFIDHARHEALAALVPQPPVLHGASGVPAEPHPRFRAAGGSIEGAVGIHPEVVTRAVSSGIAKVNGDTDLRLAFTTAVRETLGRDAGLFDPRQILGPARE